MLAQRMSKATEGVDQRAIDQTLKGTKQIKAIEQFMQQHRSKQSRASKLTDVLEMPKDIANVGPSTKIKTANDAEKWDLAREHIKKLFIGLAPSMDRNTKSRLYKAFIVFSNEIKKATSKVFVDK